MEDGSRISCIEMSDKWMRVLSLICNAYTMPTPHSSKPTLADFIIVYNLCNYLKIMRWQIWWCWRRCNNKLPSSHSNSLAVNLADVNTIKINNSHYLHTFNASHNFRMETLRTYSQNIITIDIMSNIIPNSMRKLSNIQANSHLIKIKINVTFSIQLRRKRLMNRVANTKVL